MTSKTPLSVQEQIKSLGQNLTGAQTSFDLWEGIREFRCSRDGVNLMRHYPEIFPHLERALFDSFIVSLYSLYETRRGRISVPELVRSLKSSLVAIKHKGLEGKVSELKVIWKKIGILRNQIVAHQASNCKPEDSFAAADIPGEEFQEFFRKSKCLLKSISSEVIGKNLTFNNKSKRSLEALLRDLRQHCSLKLVHPEPVEG